MRIAKARYRDLKDIPEYFYSCCEEARKEMAEPVDPPVFNVFLDSIKEELEAPEFECKFCGHKLGKVFKSVYASNGFKLAVDWLEIDEGPCQ